MKYQIYNCNTDAGERVNGTSLGPKVISKSLVLKDVINIDNSISFKKSEIKYNNIKNLKEINYVNELLYNKIIENKDKFNIVLGGDHSISIASILASNKINNNLGVMWIDAHTDFNTITSTRTGNVHGLPLISTIKNNNDVLSSFHNGEYINNENIVVVGARSIDEWERPNLKNNNILVFTTNDIKLKGIDNIMNEAFNYLMSKTNNIHISFDLDLIDPKLAPGVSVPEVNGINLSEVSGIIDSINKHSNVIRSLDLVEYNPLLDKDNKTLDIAVNIIKSLINFD